MSKGLRVFVFSIMLIFTGVVLANSALAAPVGAAASSPVNDLAMWISSSYVASIILAIGLAGILLELFTVGHGIAGTLGATALVIYFGSNIMAGHIGWGAVLWFILGLILVFLEILVFPGGIAGLFGAGLMFWSVFLVAPTVHDAIVSIAISSFGTGLIFWMGFRYLTKRNLWSKMILKDRQRNKEGYQAPQADLIQLLNLEGVTITPLRPSGTADFAGRRVDVVSEGEFIPSDVRVKVIMVEGTRVVVRQHN